MQNIKQELIHILTNKKVNLYIQPIVSLTYKNIIGYEAIIRGPSDSPLHSNAKLFSIANHFNLLKKLELITQESIIHRYASLGIREKLFISVNVSTFIEADFEQSMLLNFLEEFGIAPSSIVIELKEYQPTDNSDLMLKTALKYRDMGFEIALNDLDTSYSGLKFWSEILPEYIKINNHFVEGIAEDPIKFKFISSIQNIASSLHCNVIATGVETEEEFRTIEKLGITHAQGNYFGRPALFPLKHIDSQLFVSENPNNDYDPFNSTKPISSICNFIQPVSSEMPISEVMLLFQQNSSLTILPLVDNHTGTGIIFRELFISKLFSTRYGLELHGKKPIRHFIDKTPLSIDANISIQAVSKQLTSTMRNDTAFIITHNNKYAGIGTIMDVLEEITHLQIKYARHANPLTLLPGSVPINECINRSLEKRIPFSVAYFDLDNFKPFNDIYGYSAGDEIIKALGNILIECVPIENGQVGHIGGDDFIVIFTCENWYYRCEVILGKFKNIISKHYKEDDLKAGGIHAESRYGEKKFYPLISLSIGVVDPNSTAKCKSYVDIADLAAKAKKQSKKIEGNSLYVSESLYTS